MSNIERIQMQLRSSAGSVFETLSLPPFICFFNPDEAAPYVNYAMPDEKPSGDIDAALDRLVAAFHRRGRRPRFEYLESFAPDPGDVLERRGFELEMRAVLMICTPQTMQNAPAIPGLEVKHLNHDASFDEFRDLVTVQRRAFGNEDAPLATAEEAEQFRHRFDTVQFFLARLNNEAVGAGSLTQPENGIAEVAGISTAVPFRRRGIAAVVTNHIAQAGFDSGLDTIFLTAANKRAGGVYERVGFLPSGGSLAYIL